MMSLLRSVPLFLSLLIIASPCLAQLSSRLSIGIVGGGVATSSWNNFKPNPSESKRYTLGPFAEWRLTDSFRLHTGVTYQRVGQSDGGCFLTYCYFSGTRANTIQMPVLIRWRLVRSTAVPFLTGGYSHRRVTRTAGLPAVPTRPITGGRDRLPQMR